MKTLLIIAMWMCSVSALAQWQRVEMTDAEAAEITDVEGIGPWVVIASREIRRTTDIADRLLWQLATGIPATVHPISLAVHHGTVYAVVHDTVTHVLVSTDSARSFQDLTPTWSLPCEPEQYLKPDLSIDAEGPALYVQCVRGELWRSTNEGTTWSLVQPHDGDRSGFWAKDSMVIVSYAMQDTSWISLDAGTTWASLVLPPLSSVVGIGTEQVIYENRKGTVYRSADTGSTWTPCSIRYEWQCSTSVVPIGNVDMTTGELLRSTDQGVDWQYADDGMGRAYCSSPDPWNVVHALYPTRNDLIARVIVPTWPAVPDMGGKPAWYRRSMSEVVVSVDESVDGSRFAVRDEQYLRGSVPYTTLRVDRDVTVEMFNVLGERVGSYELEAGEHHLDTPMPTLLVMKPLHGR